MRRSRYAPRYGEFEQHREPVIPPEPGRLDRESYFVDIAGGNFGNVRISCWLKSEDFTPGRRWGKVGTSDVAIVPFGTTAQLFAQNVKLKTFEIELFLSEIGPQGSGPASFPGMCHGAECQAHSKIYLMHHPAPAEVTQRSTRSCSTDARTTRPWKLRSAFITDCDRHSRAARWTWEAHGHEPVPLHGAMALRHQGNPFVIACRTRGKVSVPLRRRVRLRLDFNNQTQRPEWWTLSPQISYTDLSRSVSEMEAETQRLNQNRTSSASVPSTRERAGSGTEPELQGGSNFRHVNIGGNARVIVGSGSFERREGLRQSSPRRQGHDSQDVQGVLPQNTEQVEGTQQLIQ